MGRLPESNTNHPLFLPNEEIFAFEILGNLWEDFSAISTCDAAKSYQQSLLARVIAQGRSNYLDGLDEIKKLYIQNGKKVSRELAIRHVQLRDLFKESVRREFSALSLQAWYPLDMMRDRIREYYGKMSAWAKIDAGEYKSAIEASYKANQFLGRNFVRVTRAASRYLGAGSLLFLGLEVSDNIQKLNAASTPQELGDGLEALVTTTSTAAFATICAVATIGSAGALSVVACGVLPVLGGIAVGRGARNAKEALEKQDYRSRLLLNSAKET